MYIKKIAAALTAVCLLSCVSCTKSGGDVSITVNEDGVGELITPDEDSEEYSLGSYRISGNGVKLYYDDDIPTEAMLALEKYFTCFQDRDFETYKTVLFPDYAERYDHYLQEVWDYELDHSFELNCEGIRSVMVQEITGEYDTTEITDYSGDFTITRIRGEAPELADDETEEDRVRRFFSSYLDDVFDMDYYEYVAEQCDELEYMTFYIIAEGEDGEEHLIISDYDILFAVKDGKYYTFG